jgi:hypothetical protein
VAGIGHGERLARKWDAVAREYRDAFRRGEFIGIEPKVPGERFIQPDEARRDDGGGRQTRKQALRQPRVAVSKGKMSVASVGASISCSGRTGRLSVPVTIELGVPKGIGNGGGFHESTRWRRRRRFLAGGRRRSCARAPLFGRLIGAGLACSATGRSARQRSHVPHRGGYSSPK